MMSYYLEPVEAGMFLSNEPGYYKAGEFGVRIESDIIAVPMEPKFKSGNRPFLQFETLTKVVSHGHHLMPPLDPASPAHRMSICQVPMCQDLIDVDLLSKADVEWLNAFHQDCFDTVSPLIQDNQQAMDWLLKNTAPLTQKS